MSQSEFLFETERLLVRAMDPSRDSDVEESIRVHSAEVSKQPYVGSRSPLTFADAKKSMTSRRENQYIPFGFGGYFVFQKPSAPGAEPLMAGTLSMVREEDAEYPDIGWAMLDEALGKGFATEAAMGLIKHCRAKCGVTDVVAYTAEANGPSRRLLDRLGFKHVVTIEASHFGTQKQICAYALGAEAEALDAEYYRRRVQQRIRAHEKLNWKQHVETVVPADIPPVEVTQ